MVELTFLAASGAFDADTAFGYLVRHAIPGVERIDLNLMALTRLLPTQHGPLAVTVALSPGGVDVELPGRAHDPPADLLHLVTDWFDLDTDLDEVGRVLDVDPALAEIGRLRPGLRLLGYPDPYEATIVTVLGQQVSVRAAGTFAGRLVAAYGRTGPDAYGRTGPDAYGRPGPDAYGRPGPDGLSRMPDPERLTEVPLGELQQAVGVTHSRARTLHAVARLFADGFTLKADPESRQALLDLPGIGPWTVDYLAMRALHDRDACPASDLVLRRALGLHKPAEVLARAERWRPFRAYAVMRLWTAAVTGLPVSPAGGAG